MIQAAFAQMGTVPAPGGQTAQGTGRSPDRSDSPHRQKERLYEKYQFTKAYWDSVTREDVDEVYQERDGSQTSAVTLPEGEQFKEKVAPSARPTRVEAMGYILPTGYYLWDGRQGIVPNPTMAMPGYTAPLQVKDSGIIGPTMALFDAMDPSKNLRTTTITNGDFAAIMAAKGEMMNQLRAQPDRWRPAMQAAMEVKQSMQSNNAAREAEHNAETAWYTVEIPLINIANEEVWQPCAPDEPFKSYAQAAWMVGQMYKEVYIPMAILLLLPGAILTQMKTMVKTGFLPDLKGTDEDLFSPFAGIMRSVLAIFLIPATQLFVSYTIDVGNSLTYELVNCPYWDLQLVLDWRAQQMYEAKLENQLNYWENTDEPSMEGKAFWTEENRVKNERQNYLTSTNQQWFNTLNALLNQGMVALNAFQLVMIMYLFLLGPVAAALYAWPGVGADIFKGVYANWMDGVVLVSLWKFWWALILLTMMVRLQVNADLGGGWNDQFEMFMCASFCALLMYVPFNPFDFKPGQAVASVLDSAQSQVSKGGSGAAVAGSTSPTGGSGSQGHQSATSAGPAGAGGKAPGAKG